MASRGKKDGLAVRMGRLIGIFVLLIAVFGGVFTLGYMMGRGQFDTRFHLPGFAPVHAGNDVAKVPPASNAADPDEPPAEAKPVQPVASAKPKALTQPKVKPAAAPVESGGGSSPTPARTVSSTNKPAKPAARGPFIPRGATVLQVAALGRQTDALALAQALQQKKFPAFVLNPSTDNYYRVQVGPYADTQSANAARHKLEAAGFNSIIKR